MINCRKISSAFAVLLLILALSATSALAATNAKGYEEGDGSNNEKPNARLTTPTSNSCVAEINSISVTNTEYPVADLTTTKIGMPTFYVVSVPVTPETVAEEIGFTVVTGGDILTFSLEDLTDLDTSGTEGPIINTPATNVDSGNGDTASN